MDSLKPTPKVFHNSAQGNTLGNGGEIRSTLKGLNTSLNPKDSVRHTQPHTVSGTLAIHLEM